MKKLILTMMLLWSVMFLPAQNTVTVRFTAATESGLYCPFDAVTATNVTRGWTETLVYPDTVLTMSGSVGIGEQMPETFHLGDVYPNPFVDQAHMLLELPEAGEVLLRMVSMDGKLVASQRMHLEAGTHRVTVIISKPQVAFLAVATLYGLQASKLIGIGHGGEDAITVDYVSNETKNLGKGARGNATGEFEPGDLMRYEGLLSNGGMTNHSLVVEQAQYNNETVTLRFQLSQPTVNTSEVSNVTQTSATCGGQVTYAGGLTVSARGVCWSTSANPTIGDSHTNDGTGTGVFNSNLTGLAAGTTYYLRAYAVNLIGIAYGEQKTFTTQDPPPGIVLPTVTTNEVTGVTQTTATCGGNVTNAGNGTVSAKGVCWSTSPNPTISDNHTTNGTGTGSFTSNITGLTANTTYYVRAYATNEAGTAYGTQRTFTTEAIPVVLPTVTTNEVTGISQTTATCGGNVTDDGYGFVSERGVCWSTSANPTLNDSHTSNGTGMGAFTSGLTGLNPSTTYYVRAFATNEAGTAYGEQKTFTTQDPPATLPTVTTNDVTSITRTTATCGGNVTNDGGGAVTERGVCWSTTQEPTIGDNHTLDGSGMGAFTSALTGLTAGTTYYVRAYATNEAGTAYGTQKTFTTEAPPPAVVLPTVTTADASSITQTTATSGGNVTNDGNATVTARGVCWSEIPNPTISGDHTTNGSGTGSFTSSLTGLTASTTYYVRAYATNSAGTAYGEEKTFSTEAIPVTLPTVTTSNVSDITQTGAVCGGNVTNDGNGLVTAKGVCWSTSQNPTIDNGFTFDGTGLGAFTSTLMDLTAGTTYYVRAYATNSAGTAYGSQKTFTTETPPPAVVLPTVTTNNVTGVTETTATCGGNVTNDGNGTVYRGVCWSTSQNPTVNDGHSTDGTGTGAFTSQLTGLTPNTTYYVRAYATNTAGTAYGSQKTFTTDPEGPPAGALDGIFTVSSTQTVSFSQGNLQYQASTNTWRFATHQYDVIGGDNANISSTYSGWIDLFGWGTSGYNHGAVCYQPWSTDQIAANYYAYGDANNDLNSETGQADWGYNPISNGGNTQNSGWRTLSQNEWKCLLNTRSTASGIRYAKAKVNGQAGLILLPDDWSSSYYALNNTNDGAAAFDGNVITTSQWSTLEQHGAVFLPAAGQRQNTVSGVGTSGIYATSTHSNANNDCIMSFNASSVHPTATSHPGTYRYNGQSVRLARNSDASSTGVIPTVNTHSVTNITTSEASCGGNVTNSGDSPVTAKGVCWSWYQNPTLNDFNTNDGTGTGSFTSLMISLESNTTYYVRAYATNSAGTAYGTQKTFTTAIAPPYVNTLNPTAITINTATCAGYCEHNGGFANPVTISARGLCWSTSPNPTIVDSHSSNGTGEGSFTAQLTGLSQGTTYYVRAYATNEGGTAYGPQKTFTTQSIPAPTGAIDGLFSVSQSQQVYFSQGNLQYRAATNTWRFATNQWDCVGQGNSNLSMTYSGWIDLFGWGTSNWNSGNTYYRPWDTMYNTPNNNSIAELYGPFGVYNLRGEYALCDWGVRNPISNGGNTAGQWRLLTHDEWRYLILWRETASGIRFALAKVNNVNGLILLPDDWNPSYYSLNNTNQYSAAYTSNVITASQWSILESHGAVFLPSGGSRWGTSITEIGEYGGYWSSTCAGSNCAKTLLIHNHVFCGEDQYDYRCAGNLVRLVRPAQ